MSAKGEAAVVALFVVSVVLASAAETCAQVELKASVEEWGQLPDGREWGSVTGVQPDPDGNHMWVLDRCGANGCIDSGLDPVLKFDLDGKLVKSFGAGLFAFPHGFFVDHEGNVWVTEGAPDGDARGEAGFKRGMGHQVFKLSPEGEVVMTLGEGGVPGDDEYHFNGPANVVVAPTGEIFVADGHGIFGNNRVVKFSRDGRFITTWGTTGFGPTAGEISEPHSIAMDSRGRVFVGDRKGARIQIFDQNGTWLDEWRQFGAPSSLFISHEDDRIYVTDSQVSRLAPFWQGTRTDAWEGRIRIGDVRNGSVSHFVRSNAQWVGADRMGNVYGTEITGTQILKYVRGVR